MSSETVQTPVPADFNAPDRVLYGLTARQVAILAATGAVFWVAYHALSPMLPTVVVGIAALPIGAVAAAVALGRRDGISMDRWLSAAVKASRSTHHLVAACAEISAAPGWAPAARTPTASRTRRGAKAKTAPLAVAPLRLPARRISASGVVQTDDGTVALTAATTVNFDLRTGQEQYALIEGMGRWLNSLSGPVQIVICTRRVDLYAYALQIEDRLDTLPHPALADAAVGYAQFLRDLTEDRDPLDRHVLIAHHAGPHTDTAVPRRQAEQTARALSGLGAATEVLHGGQVTDALAAACDPWRHTGIGRATPDAVITGPSDGSLL